MVRKCYSRLFRKEPCGNLDHHFDRTANKETGGVIGNYWYCSCTGKFLGSQISGYDPKTNPRPNWCPLEQLAKSGKSKKVFFGELFFGGDNPFSVFEFW